MADSQGLEAQYGAIIDGIASLKDLQPGHPSQLSRLTLASRGGTGRAPSSTALYQRAASGKPSTRVSNATNVRQPKLSADYAASDSADSHRPAAQPGFNPTLRGRTARPASRERVSSAWAAPQYSTIAHQQQQNSQLAAEFRSPGGVCLQPFIMADKTLPAHKAQPQLLLRQVTAPQSATLNYGSSQKSSLEVPIRKMRPNSARRQSSATTAQRPLSRQQDQKPTAVPCKPGHLIVEFVLIIKFACFHIQQSRD